MAKVKKNSAKFQQDAVIARLYKDARSKPTGKTATDIALANGISMSFVRLRKAAELEARPKLSFKFLATGI